MVRVPGVQILCTTEDIFLLSSDTFSVIITDALGGSVLDTFFVTPTDSIITSVTIVNASDSLTSDGAIYTSITGGTPPFTYFKYTLELCLLTVYQLR